MVNSRTNICGELLFFEIVVKILIFSFHITFSDSRDKRTYRNLKLVKFFFEFRQIPSLS